MQGSHQGVEVDHLAPDKEMEILSLELVPSGITRLH